LREAWWSKSYNCWVACTAAANSAGQLQVLKAELVYFVVCGTYGGVQIPSGEEAQQRRFQQLNNGRAGVAACSAKPGGGGNLYGFSNMEQMPQLNLEMQGYHL
jgi:hypothetical protein